MRKSRFTDAQMVKIVRWLADERIETAAIVAGKPWQNGIDESFNGNCRDESLSLEWFRIQMRADAQV